MYHLTLGSLFHTTQLIFLDLPQVSLQTNIAIYLHMTVAAGGSVIARSQDGSLP